MIGNRRYSDSYRNEIPRTSNSDNYKLPNVSELILKRLVIPEKNELQLLEDGYNYDFHVPLDKEERETVNNYLKLKKLNDIDWFKSIINNMKEMMYE